MGLDAVFAGRATRDRSCAALLCRARLHGKSSRVTPFQAVQYFAEHGQCALFRSRVLGLAASCGVMTSQPLGKLSQHSHPSAEARRRFNARSPKWSQTAELARRSGKGSSRQNLKECFGSRDQPYSRTSNSSSHRTKKCAAAWASSLLFARSILCKTSSR